MKFKHFLKIFSILLCCALIFAGILFSFTRENLIGVDVPKTDEPYSKDGYLPENTTVLFVFPDNFGAIVELDFSKEFINALIIKDPSKQRAKIYGFNIDHICTCDYSFIIDFIDIIGGITLNRQGESFRYTGVQVCNLTASFTDDTALRAAILEGVFSKISKSGFSNEALSCIIEETRTTLSAPACYGWTENMRKLCNSFNIINER